MQGWAWCCMGQSLCRDSSWPLWERTPEGFSKGHSKSWTLQPLHVCPRGGYFLLQNGFPGAEAVTVLKSLAFFNGWEC